ncbi:LacI family DNA-binding transcriptional regulator [Kitasatospora sp. NPDC057223]|uniref:LacI family DNA-binding transcriptional regulator n=1 Tax=Kitasatospora sp. NPDC057223 TaxID=3346055 RepID=UPI0036406D6F
MKRLTISDIAARAGVSKVAVSYALNDRPGVSEETRAAIKAIAAELDWRPSRAARSLKAANADAIGLVVCRPTHILGHEPFFMQLISGIESVLAGPSLGLMLQVVSTHEEESAVHRRWWGERQVDGVLMLDTHVSDTRTPVLERLGMPTVILGPPQASAVLPTVWSDDAAGAREVVQYLVALGHRRIARVAGPAAFAHTAIRDETVVRACEEAGLPAPAVVHADYTGDEGARATRRLLLAAERPTAVLYDNDLMAVAGLGAAQELNLHVPRDLSIVAWDDSALTRVVRPAITALTRDIRAYGARAAQTLLAEIADGSGASSRTEAARLVPRASTSPVPR